ncbi:hypothetical protein BBN63_10295 [Streptomyces niveus]|uniref:Uncharacterized protein n=1 Tax=Streptomyces niveus TaxID=193462 RepID=A0A1U9QRZ5_STRNV|nr:hypothetical protein BBN63_10295 [Streptomyces niveus]
MDSGNQGYAYRTERSRPGGGNVMQVTPEGGFRRRNWRETSQVSLELSSELWTHRDADGLFTA